MDGMVRKVIFPALICTFFSFQVKAQTENTGPSKHPKMDKYYPRPADPAAPEITPAPVVTPTATPQTTSPVPRNTSTIAAPPTAERTTPTVIPDTTTKVQQVVTVEKPTPPPPQPVKVSAPVAPPYNPNRLGSSTKEYDTWEKNNNGAGSVTTHGK